VVHPLRHLETRTKGQEGEEEEARKEVKAVVSRVREGRENTC
jgi:hypothetical protein